MASLDLSAIADALSNRLATVDEGVPPGEVCISSMLEVSSRLQAEPVQLKVHQFLP